MELREDIWAKTKKKNRYLLTHDPGPTSQIVSNASQIVSNAWSRITGKSKCSGYLAQHLTKGDLLSS